MEDGLPQIENTGDIQPQVRESPTLGAILRAAREQQALGQAEMANRLRFSIRQIEALENDDFTKLPSGTFLRGFIRNYAKALGLDPVQVVAKLETNATAMVGHQSLDLVVPSQNIKFPARSTSFGNQRLKIMFAGVLCALFGWALWVGWGGIQSHTGQSTSVKSMPEIAAFKTIEAVSEKSPVTLMNLPPVSANVHASTVISTPLVPTGDLLPKMPAPGTIALGFRFTGNSWMEITDGRNKVLVSRHFVAGDAEEITGRAPLSVVIGNAKATHMIYNGKEFDLAPYTRVLVARITLK